ncbi:MAG: amidohydrolase [Alphaproteobacteria bacterium]|nr:amidohydrolase [Alphaproteobacteria bacterium]
MGTPIRRIAVEEAFVTPDVAAGWREILARPDVEPGFAKLGGIMMSPAARPLVDRLLEVGPQRLARMDAAGIDLQVLALTAPGVQVLDTGLAVRLAAEANDFLAEAIAAHPNRFAGLAAVAPQDPKAAAREIERAATRLKLNGLIINSHTRGERLDLPKFAPVLEAAEAFDMPIYLHPREPASAMVAPYLDYGLYFATWGFSAESGLHAMRLIMSGTFERYPRLRIILGHMGEAIPFWLQRIDNRHAAQVHVGASQRLQKKPSEFFRDNFLITTSGFMSMPALRLCLDVLGVERILFAVDYPYENDSEAVRFMDEAKITEDERRQIYQSNAERVFKLKAISNG